VRDTARRACAPAASARHPANPYPSERRLPAGLAETLAPPNSRLRLRPFERTPNRPADAPSGARYLIMNGATGRRCIERPAWEQTVVSFPPLDEVDALLLPSYLEGRERDNVEDSCAAARPSRCVTAAAMRVAVGAATPGGGHCSGSPAGSVLGDPRE